MPEFETVDFNQSFFIPQHNTITVYDTIKDLNAQYMTKLKYIAIFMLIYSLYNFFTNRKQWTDIKSFVVYQSHTAAVIFSIFLVLISLIYLREVDL